MLLIQETIDKLGYDPSTLSSNSHKKVFVKCDYCNTIVTKPMFRYTAGQSTQIKKDSCKSCKSYKQQEYIRTNNLINDIVKKRKNTNIQKYNNITPANNPIIQQRIQSNNLKKYGVAYSIGSNEVQNKIKNSILNKYGVDNIFKNTGIQEKIKNTLKNKYGVPFPSQINIPPETIEKLNNKEWLVDQHITQKKCLTQISKELGLGEYSTTISNYCKKFNIPIQKYNISLAEKEIQEFLTSLGITFTTNDRSIITPYELDIFIPDHKLAIEYCGLYWHSDAFKDKYYHYNKLKACTNKNIRLITIFEDEWINKKNIVQDRIKHILKKSNNTVYARKCKVVLGSYKDFITKHHIQGYCSSTKEYALEYGGEIVSVMTFGKPRFNKNYEWELIRFVTSANIPGGASKLLQQFIKDVNPKSIISYCDLRWGTGNLYSQLGFNHIKNTTPGYFYIKDQKRYNRTKFQKQKLIKKGMNKSLSESKIMTELGFNKIYDCGHAVFTKFL